MEEVLALLVGPGWQEDLSRFLTRASQEATRGSEVSQSAVEEVLEAWEEEADDEAWWEDEEDDGDWWKEGVSPQGF